eukprot:791468-Prymnesium_polylepis.1
MPRVKFLPDSEATHMYSRQSRTDRPTARPSGPPGARSDRGRESRWRCSLCRERPPLAAHPLPGARYEYLISRSSICGGF